MYIHNAVFPLLSLVVLLTFSVVVFLLWFFWWFFLVGFFFLGGGVALGSICTVWLRHDRQWVPSLSRQLLVVNKGTNKPTAQ